LRMESYTMAEGFSTYHEALQWLHGLLRFGQKPGLDRMNWLLAHFDHPQRHLAFVHVAGTNGKGSTCAFIAQMLMEAGYSVGSFTSPYLLDFRERIRYNGAFIPEQDLLALVNQVKPLVERCAESTEYGSPTEFEVITVIAILYFARIARPAVVVWETGLGGRLDSTNVVHPLVTVITNVGLDHTNVLGDTIAAIAREKAGIIKPGVPVVVGEADGEALAVIEETARSKRSSVYRLGKHFQAEQIEERLGEQRIRYQSIYRRSEAEYRLHLNGVHQTANAAVAVMAVDLLREFYSFLLEEEEIFRGLQQTRWPGRLEVVSQNPLILLDGAHNAEGMEALVKSIAKLAAPNARIHLLIGALADKPLSLMAAAWQTAKSRVEKITLTTFDFPRAASVEQLADAFYAGEWDSDRLETTADWRSFLRTWISKQQEDDCLVVCGSLYFIAQVRAFFPITVEEAGE
jgi:dihydrofolate synthase/folylpolyglutamate synthase